MRALVIFALLLGCAGCQSIGEKLPQKSEQAQTAGLSAKPLAVGECGLFFWDTDRKRKFVFFHREGQSNAALWYEEKELFLSSAEYLTGIADLPNIAHDYRSETGLNVSMKGRLGENVDGGIRIQDALLQVTKPDGWAQVMPVSGIYVCQ